MNPYGNMTRRSSLPNHPPVESRPIWAGSIFADAHVDTTMLRPKTTCWLGSQARMCAFVDDRRAGSNRFQKRLTTR